MNDLAPLLLTHATSAASQEPVRSLSRRGFLGAASGALLLGVGLPVDPALAQAEGAAAIAPKPGTDGALAMALINSIIAQGLVDQDYVDNHTVGFEELERIVRGESVGTRFVPKPR